MSIVEVSQAQGRTPVTVLHLQDRINLGNAAEMEKAAREAFEGGVRNLVVDFSRTPSITSAGIRALVSVFKLFGADGGRVKLAGLSDSIREVFDIAGIIEKVEIFDSVEEAAASF
jgi:anti-anti-sigma factor